MVLVTGEIVAGMAAAGGQDVWTLFSSHAFARVSRNVSARSLHDVNRSLGASDKFRRSVPSSS